MERFERWCHDCARDVRYAGRTLLGSPGFTATVVLSLALGIGANTAIFSILHALVLRSLPVSDPERLVVVTRNQVSTPYPLFRHLRERSQTLDGVLAFRTAPMRLEVNGVTERAPARWCRAVTSRCLAYSPPPERRLRTAMMCRRGLAGHVVPSPC